METVLYDFNDGPDGGADGAAPTGVVLGQNGVLYGATVGGGIDACVDSFGCGTVFSLTPPASPGGTCNWRKVRRVPGSKRSA
jgi:uncharacterized repeat protein (TIGR03803 family)